MPRELVLAIVLALVCAYGADAASRTMPHGMKLDMVQIVTRHGARVPYQIVATDPTVWDCHLSPLSIPNVGEEMVIDNPGRLYRKVYMPQQEVFQGNCSQGELLAIGAQQHVELGQQFRSYYVDTGFLSDSYDRTEVFIRSTDVTRTVKCAESFMLGMFPVEQTNSSLIDLINVHVVETTTDYIQPSSSCSRMIQDCNAIQRHPDFVERWQAMLPLQFHLSQAWNITAEEFPWWGGVRNTLESRAAAGKPLPDYLDQSMVDQINDFCNFEMTSLYGTTGTQRLGIGRFTEHLINNIKRAMVGDSPIKFFMYSGHDITLGLLLSSFEVFDGTWPAFASHFTIELLSNDDGVYFIRLFYNDKLVYMPECDEFCPADQVIDTLRKKIPDDWAKECDVVGSVTALNDLTTFLCTS